MKEITSLKSKLVPMAMAGEESGFVGAESSTPLATPTATPTATPMSTRSVKWEKDVEDAAGDLQRPLLYTRGTNTTSQMAIVGANTCPIESLDYEYALVLPHPVFLKYHCCQSVRLLQVLLMSLFEFIY